MFQWNQKSQPEMNIDSYKLTGSVPKFKVAPTYCQPKPNGFQTITTIQKNESLLVQSFPMTTSMGGTNNHPTKTHFKSRWWSWRAKLLAVKHCTRCWLLGRDQHSQGCQSLGQPDRYSTNASICDWNGTGQDGRSVVTLGSTTASTASVLLWWFDMLRSTNPREESRVAKPPMPSTFMKWRWHCKCRRCAKLSVMNEVEDAESNRVLAFVMEPSALTIWTWHVVSTTGWGPSKFEWCVTVSGL